MTTAQQENGDTSAAQAGEPGADFSPLDVLGVMLEGCASLLASAVFLQLLCLPLDVLRLGWWPVVVSVLAFGASLCLGWRERGGDGTSAAPVGCGRLFRLRLSALLSLGLTPLLQWLPVTIRVAPAFLGWHLSLCILLAMASMICHQQEFAAIHFERRRGGACGWMAAVDLFVWRRCIGLVFGMVVFCVLLLLLCGGEVRMARIPDAVLYGMAGFGQVPPVFGWMICLGCAVSGVLRLAMVVKEDLQIQKGKR